MHARRTASLFGAFCPFLLGGRQPACVQKNKNSSKIQGCPMRSSSAGAEMLADKRPQRILCVFSRALTRYEGISARQNRVCPCQSTQTIPYRTTSPIAAAFGEVVRLGQECQKRSFIRLFSSGVFVGFSVRCFFCRQPAAHSKKPWGGFIQIRGIHHGVGQFLRG